MGYSIHLAFCVFLFAIIHEHAFVIQSIEDDIADIRQRVLEMVIWPNQQNIPNVIQAAIGFNNTLNDSCYWKDVNYTDKSLADWATLEHLTRVNTMIQALTVPGSRLNNNTEFAIRSHCALNVWLTRDWSNPNWWFNQIGVPLLTAGQLLMLGHDATEFEIQKITDISYRADWWHHDPGTGANLVWMIQIELYRSLATNNRTGIEQGFKRIWEDIAILPLGGQGIQTDWSYHFHGTQLLSGAYGQDWVGAMMIFMLCSQNTQYEANQEQLTIVGKYLTEGDAWMIIDNIWDWHAVGREIDRPEALMIVSFQSNWIRSLANLISSNELRTNLNNFADRLDYKPNAVPLVGNRHFYTSDYQVHRRLNWTSTIKMQSVRTQPIECINEENQKAEHLGQGVLNLYLENPNDYRQIFPLFDWQSINGITVEHDIPIEPCTRGQFSWSPLGFVGGVSDGDYGLAIMDTATHNLTAKRSWHFYDQAIFAYASHLRLTTNNNARTTLSSRRLSTGNIQVAFFNGTMIILQDGINYSFPYLQDQSKNVQWIHLSDSNVGYLLQKQGPYSSVGVEVSTKTNSYRTIGPYDQMVTARTVNIWIDHGIGLFTHDYNYAIVPSIIRQSLPQLISIFENEHIFDCISNQDNFHAMTWPSLQRASFALWNNLTINYSCRSTLFSLNVQLTDAGVYLFNETTKQFSITASHPTRFNTSLTINIDRLGSGIGCNKLADGTTNVTIVLPSSDQYLGQSITVTCQKLNPID